MMTSVWCKRLTEELASMGVRASEVKDAPWRLLERKMQAFKEDVRKKADEIID